MSCREKWEVIKVDTHPLVDGRWVKVKAHIRNNATNVVRVYDTEEILKDDEECPNDWSWTNGNYGCDCNRELFFLRANGDVEPEDSVCSTGRFSVNLQNPVTGEFYYKEF